MSPMRALFPLALTVAASLLTGCLRGGVGGQVLWEPTSRKAGFEAHGTLAGVTLEKMDADPFAPTHKANGAYFGLQVGGGYGPRVESANLSVGFTAGWLWPNGLSAFTFRTTQSFRTPEGDRSPEFLLLLTVAPRFELDRSQSRSTRSAKELAIPVSGGLSFGQGFAPQVGAGLEMNWMAWGTRYH